MVHIRHAQIGERWGLTSVSADEAVYIQSKE